MNESDKFLSMTEIGEIYQTTSHQIGRWLKKVGLRTESGAPSRAAFDDGYVAKRESSQPNTYFYVWDAEKTIRLLAEMEYPPAKTGPTEKEDEHD